jgi:glycosyltransferase involved in cell wall biosynthesis
MTIAKISVIILIFIYNILISSNIKKNENIDIPSISVFVPIYNKNKYLKKSFESIQKQTLKNIEIIAINDFSNDTSLQVLEELAKTDSRIKIINNDRNYGLLYSRAIGILNCRGEYILNLDPDDEFEGLDNLEYLYKIAKKSNLDIVSFGTLFKYNNQYTIKCSNFHKIYRQPKLFTSAFNSTNNLNDFLIWNKLIKKELNNIINYIYMHMNYLSLKYMEKNGIIMKITFGVF